MRGLFCFWGAQAASCCQPVAFGRRAECTLRKAQKRLVVVQRGTGSGSRQAAANYRPAALCSPETIPRLAPQVDRPLRRAMLLILGFADMISNIELATGRVRPVGGQGTARSTFTQRWGL